MHVTIIEKQGEYYGLLFVTDNTKLLRQLDNTDPLPFETCNGFEWQTNDLTRFTMVTVKMQQQGYNMIRHPYETLLCQKKTVPNVVVDQHPANESPILHWTLNHPLDYIVVWTKGIDETRSFGVFYLLNQIKASKKAFIICGHQSIQAWYHSWRKLTGGRHTEELTIITPLHAPQQGDINSACIVDYDSYSYGSSVFKHFNPSNHLFGETVIVSHLSYNNDGQNEVFIQQIKNTYPQTDPKYLSELNDWQFLKLKQRLLLSPPPPISPPPRQNTLTPISVKLSNSQQRDASKLLAFYKQARTLKKIKMSQKKLETFTSRCVISNVINDILSDNVALVSNQQVSKWARIRGLESTIIGWDELITPFKKQYPNTWGHVIVMNSVWFIELSS